MSFSSNRVHDLNGCLMRCLHGNRSSLVNWAIHWLLVCYAYTLRAKNSNPIQFIVVINAHNEQNMLLGERTHTHCIKIPAQYWETVCYSAVATIFPFHPVVFCHTHCCRRLECIAFIVAQLRILRCSQYVTLVCCALHASSLFLTSHRLISTILVFVCSSVNFVLVGLFSVTTTWNRFAVQFIFNNMRDMTCSVQSFISPGFGINLCVFGFRM